MHSLDTFAILAREHEQMLRAYVFGLVREPVLAQEITQEALVRAFLNLSSLKTTESFPAWIRRIARNAAADHYAARAREIPTDPTILDGMDEVFSAFDNAELGDLWTERVRRVEGCFGDLPEPLLQVCRLHYFEDLQAAEIADRLTVNVATIWKRMERARDILRECVEKSLALEPL